MNIISRRMTLSVASNGGMRTVLTAESPFISMIIKSIHLNIDLYVRLPEDFLLPIYYSVDWVQGQVCVDIARRIL